MVDTIVLKLKAYLEANRMTQQDLAALIGTSPQTVSRWFNRHNKISNVYRRLLHIHLDGFKYY